ncbi:uncharacterized protein LOC144501615 [Mustelus asterias]
MDLHRTIIFLNVILCKDAFFAQSFVTLDCEDVVTGILNEDTKLTCSIQSTIVKTYDHVTLSKMEKNEKRTSVFSLKAGAKQPHNRIIIIRPDSNDVSLLIQKTQLTDEGTYQYDLETVSGHRDKEITLKVKAPYSLPNVTSLLNTTTSTINLNCETTGYPQAQIHWFVNGNLTSESNSYSNKTPAGLMKITSILQTNKGRITSEDNYTCAVWNIDENVYEVQEQLSNFGPTQRRIKRKKSNLITVFVIIGVGFLALAILVVWQLQKTSQPAVRSACRISMMSSDQRTDV